jgi:hypothetical protein
MERKTILRNSLFVVLLCVITGSMALATYPSGNGKTVYLRNFEEKLGMEWTFLDPAIVNFVKL